MTSVIWWIVALAIFAALAAAAAVLVKAYLSGTSPREVFFKPKPEPRIEVIEQASMDGKRRLVLIRRDDVEHLLLTGGPVDVVIETGIGEGSRRRVAPPDTLVPPLPPAATVFSRAPRGFGSPAQTAEEVADAALKR
jgi:flagellar protein FliO/FliZ